MASAGFALAELLEELQQALPRRLVPLNFAVPTAGRGVVDELLFDVEACTVEPGRQT
jgi:hypothetical protein